MSGTGEALRLIKQGGMSVDGEKLQDQNTELEVEREYLLKIGKRGFYKVKGTIERK